MPTAFWELTGLDIQGEPDENDRRNLAEVAALEASDRFITPTQQTTELAQRLHEENTNLVRDFRWEFQKELARETPDRIGRILSENEFIFLLEKLLPIKVFGYTVRRLRGFYAWKDGRWQFPQACMQAGYMTEYSVMNFDDHDLPTNEKFRGWRTVLLRLITQGYCTEVDAHRIFGPPKINRASILYRRVLRNYRHRKEPS